MGIACCLATLITSQATHAAPPAATTKSITWLSGSTLTRASRAAARQRLGASDKFTRAMSVFDRMSRLGASDDPGEGAILRHSAEQAREWSDQEWERVSQVALSLRTRLEKLPALPWPAEIQLIVTTGLEEGEAAYCRGAAVILPHKVLTRTDDSLERLLAHELFHVLSNQNEDWRKEVYAVVGFQPCAEIPLPESLRDRKITNPDGPLVDCTIELTIEGRPIRFAPVLLASVERYDAKQGGSFFRYLTFQLLAVSPSAEGTWRPLLKEGQPWLLDPTKTPAYHERIGGNTRYIIHPDEILADNFVHLVFQTSNLATPRIILDLRETFTRLAKR